MRGLSACRSMEQLLRQQHWWLCSLERSSLTHRGGQSHSNVDKVLPSKGQDLAFGEESQFHQWYINKSRNCPWLLGLKARMSKSQGWYLHTPKKVHIFPTTWCGLIPSVAWVKSLVEWWDKHYKDITSAQAYCTVRKQQSANNRFVRKKGSRGCSLPSATEERGWERGGILLCWKIFMCWSLTLRF